MDMQANSSPALTFWIVQTEDDPTHGLNVYPTPMGEMEAKALAAEYNDAGFIGAEARKVVIGARAIVAIADEYDRKRRIAKRRRRRGV